MSNFASIIQVLANNPKDVEDVVGKFGGIGNIIRAGPSLFRIMKTITAAKDPVVEAERSADTLMYSQETKEKVEAFQKAHNLDVDGIVGNQTWSAVERELAKIKGA